ncbi:hypothetical protein ACHAXR_008466 [Thalassiosira sp. AJA248-18]
MAWNGRNVSILGAKPAVNNDAPAAGAPSSSKGGNTTSSPNNQAEAAVDAKKSAPATLASTQKSVWGGKHSKIMAIRDNSKDAPANNESSSVASNNIAPTPPLAISSTRSKDLKKEPIKMQKVVSSSPKDIKPVVGQQQPMAKEDETTNSTAGSSTTNTTITDHEDPAATLEVKVVTTTTVSLDSGKKNESSSSQEKNAAASSSSNAAPTTTVRSGKNNTSNGGANANAAAARRSGNNKGGRANNNNNNNNSGNNNSGNNNGRQNYSRGSGSGGSARRRVNNNGEKQVCSFFLRGMCNRGTSCAFKHEGPAHAPTDSAPSSSNPPIRKSPSNGSNQSMKATATTFVPSKRTFDPNKARAIQLAKEAQDQEDRSKYASSVKIIPGAEEDKKDDEEQVEEEPAFFSIDVECIATGYGSCAKGINDGCGNEGRNKEGIPSGQYNDRSHRYPGRVAMVDSDGNVLTDMIIRPPKDGAGVVSYLAPLTGLTSEMCFGSDAKSLEEAVEIIKGLLPKNGVLVGQAIDHDVEWLGLTPGKDFERMVDISEIFRQRMPAVLGQAAEVLKAKKEESKDEEEQTSSASDDLSSDEHLGFATRYRHFSLRHVCLNLLGTDIQSGVHDPITDAKYSLMLFHKYRNSSVTQLRIVRDGLHRAPITPGFAAENTPVIDGVCVSAAGYRYKFAARKIWNWFTAKKQESC